MRDIDFLRVFIFAQNIDHDELIVTTTQAIIVVFFFEFLLFFNEILENLRSFLDITKNIKNFQIESDNYIANNNALKSFLDNDDHIAILIDQNYKKNLQFVKKFLNKSDNIAKDFHEILSIILFSSRFIQDSKQKTNIKFFIDKTKNFYNIILSNDTTKNIYSNLSINNITKIFYKKNINIYIIDKFI